MLTLTEESKKLPKKKCAVCGVVFDPKEDDDELCLWCEADEITEAWFEAEYDRY